MPNPQVQEDYPMPQDMSILNDMPNVNVPFDPNGAFRQLPEVVALSAMIYGEAIKDSKDNFDKDALAVAFTAKNRSDLDRPWYGGQGLSNVILAPNQYQSVGGKEWNKFLQHKVAGTGDDDYFAKRSMQIAYAVMNGKIEDPTQGATHNVKPSDPNYKFFEEKMGMDTVKGGEFYFEPLAQSPAHLYLREVMKPTERKPVAVSNTKKSVTGGKSSTAKKQKK